MPDINIPKYSCHKTVQALKIGSIHYYALTGATITPEDKAYPAFSVSEEYVQQHRPAPGGYFVVYENGYKSFSPAEPFEAGYTKL
jgi:hypothetical protein